MKLQELLDQVVHLNDDDVIFAAMPWTLTSDAEVGQLDDEGRVPPTAVARGMSYFLEISVAKEVLEVFGRHKATAEQQRALLLYYAENDAYPQWVYEL
jgi:hypothetical protein